MFDTHLSSWLWRLIECKVSINADSSKAAIDTPAGVDESLNRIGIVRIREDSVLQRRRERRIKQVIERAIHEASKTQWMIDPDPLIVLVQVFIHVNENRLAARNFPLVNEPCQNGELIDRADRNDQCRARTTQLPLDDFAEDSFC